MEFMDSYAFRQWVLEFAVVFFLAGGFVVLAAGVGLITGSAATLRLFAAMNRWVSTRRVLKPIEVIRDTRQFVVENRRWLAGVFIAGAAFAVYGLGAWFDAQAVSFVYGLDARPASAAAWLVESARWALIVGNLAAIVIGIMLGFFPGALTALEVHGSRWYSDRLLVKGGDAMHFQLDNWVAAAPRAAGWIMTAAGLLLVGDFGIMLFGLR